MSKTRLSVIRGDGGGASNKLSRTNFVILEGGFVFDDCLIHNESKTPTQLTFRGFSNEPRIISLGLFDVDFDEFKRILKENDIKQIIDIRLSNSFERNGFSPIKFRLLLVSLSVSYIHYKQLANPFLGQIREPGLLLAKYREYLWKECRDELSELVSIVRNGPTLLVGWSSDSGSRTEQEVLIDLLGKIDRKFMFFHKAISDFR